MKWGINGCALMRSKEYNMGPYGFAGSESVLSRWTRMTGVPLQKFIQMALFAYIIQLHLDETANLNPAVVCDAFHRAWLEKISHLQISSREFNQSLERFARTFEVEPY